MTRILTANRKIRSRTASQNQSQSQSQSRILSRTPTTMSCATTMKRTMTTLRAEGSSAHVRISDHGPGSSAPCIPPLLQDTRTREVT